MHSFLRFGRVAACVALLSLWSMPSPAIDWINPAGGFFQNPNNWLGGVVPNPGDTASHNLGGLAGYTVLSNANIAIAALEIPGDPGDTVTYNMGGFVMAIDGGPAGGLSVGSGSLSLLNGIYNVAPFLTVGAGSGNVGTLNVSGLGTAIIANGPFAGAISIGGNGVGTATVSNGGLLTTVSGGDISIIGRAPAAVGVLTVDGVGSIARGHSGINVGGSAAAPGGEGILNITNMGSVETTNMVIHAGSSVNLSGGGFGTIGTVSFTDSSSATPNTLTVRTGGILRGNGTISGNVILEKGGVVSPGQSTGLLTVEGYFNMGNCVADAGGTYDMEIDSAGVAATNYDSMVVAGSVLLGGTLNLIVKGTYVPNGAHQFNVFTGSSNIVGAVESITNRVIDPATIGGTVWGDYREDNSGTGADRYFVAPRRKGDFNGASGVTGADYTTWADHFGLQWATYGEGDANGDRKVTGADYTIWADNFGQPSLDSDGVALSTYGCAVDAAAFDVEVTPDPEFDVELLGIRTMNRLDTLSPRGAGTVSAVPEPSSLVLGALALVGMAVWRASSLRTRYATAA